MGRRDESRDAGKGSAERISDAGRAPGERSSNGRYPDGTDPAGEPSGCAVRRQRAGDRDSADAKIIDKVERVEGQDRAKNGNGYESEEKPFRAKCGSDCHYRRAESRA